jgi:phosphatidylinositol alpha-mannosyltransferase
MVYVPTFLGGAAMKIAMVTQSYYPRVGGVTEHVHYLSGALRGLGHEVTIVTSGPGPEDERDVIRVGRNAVFPINGALVNVTLGLGLGRRLRDIFSREGLDLIHIHSPLEPTLPLIALMASRSVDVPVVGTFHMCARVSPAYEVFAGRLRGYADRLDGRIAVSEAARRFAMKYFPGLYRVIPNGVCFDRFRNPAEPPWRETDRPTVLYVGRFDLRKKVPWLISGFKRLLRAHPRSKLVLVGSGLTEPVCRLTALPLGDAVRFCGQVPPSRLPSHFAGSDVFCSVPGGGESFGIVLLEAMAAGKPIVGTDIAGYRDVVEHGGEGLLVPPGDTRALADALRLLVEDGQQRKAMGSMGREKARRFDWSNIAGEVTGVYNDVSGRSTPGADDELIPRQRVHSL